eukprot:307123-Chlamydomonas_euryale.AAC.1
MALVRSRTSQLPGWSWTEALPVNHSQTSVKPQSNLSRTPVKPRSNPSRGREAQSCRTSDQAWRGGPLDEKVLGFWMKTCRVAMQCVGTADCAVAVGLHTARVGAYPASAEQ